MAGPYGAPPVAIVGATDGTVVSREDFGVAATKAAAVTPHNDNDLGNVARMLYVGGAGDLKVNTSGGDTVTLVAVPTGTFIRDVKVSRVHATGTTATNIVAFWGT